MPQEISPVEWLRNVLSWFQASNVDADSTYTSTETHGQIWTCEIRFLIPARVGNQRHLIHKTGMQSPTALSAEYSAVRLCLDALARVGYFLPDFSHFKIQALRAGQGANVAEISEHFAEHNTMDVVWLCIYINTRNSLLHIHHFFLKKIWLLCSFRSRNRHMLLLL